MKSALKLFRYVKPYWRWATIAPILMVLEVAMDLMQPRMVQRIVDEGIAKLNLDLVVQTGGLMIGLALIGVIGGMGCGLFAEMTRLTNDVTQVQDAVGMILRMLVRAPMLLVGSLIMGIITSPQLAFLPLILMPIELLAVYLIIAKATPLFTKVQERLDHLNEVMQENLAGVRVVKAFVRQKYEEMRFGKANLALTNQIVMAGRTVAIMPSFMMLTMNMGIIGVIWFGGMNVTRGTMHVGQIIAFVNYLTTTLFSLMMVSQLIIMLARAEASARRIQEVLESEPKVKDRPEAKKMDALKGHLAFENVTFCYDGNGSDPVLKGVSFTAEPGETVALLGTTGAGKSSLVHLIPRFYDVDSGRVTVDGEDVRNLEQESLRRSIGIALQDVVLFSGTIRDNIRFGRPDATDEEVIAAAKAAQAHDFIMSFPDGYDTQLGQRGVNLSGGQKQRIAIARALLLNPAILILDDSTSSVDVETESKIQEALEQVKHQRKQTSGTPFTSIVIAQRISTVLNADKILVLDDGQIAAQGRHHELMKTSPIYREIYESQLGNGVVDYAE
jgi:ATP-binding cassette subfamily B protein